MSFRPLFMTKASLLIRRFVVSWPKLGQESHTCRRKFQQKALRDPHWWMQYDSWRDFLKAESVVQSLLNILSFLHFQLPLAELTQRVADGEPRLFRSEVKIPESNAISKKFLAGLDDRAMQIVGQALLLKGEPQGYQLRLRMVLFFGWDFGIADLSNDELYSFLYDLKIISITHDPETLRRYRNRIRKMIEKSPYVKAVTIQSE